jgi:parallel beta-helix repeat protein
MSGLPVRWAAAAYLCLTCAGASAGSALYVAPDGDDGAPGTVAAPLATPQGALAAVRAARAAGEGGTATVILRGGQYCLDQTLALEPGDDHIAWVAYPGERSQVVGGRLITGLKPGAGGVWSVALPQVKAGAWSFGSLFVNGQRMIRARQPNFDPSDPYRGGFPYTARDATGFGVAVGSIHNVGDWMDYKVSVPADGEYTFWVCYGALNSPFGNDSMDGRTALSVDGGAQTLLTDLPDTGSWGISRWGQCAAVTLTAGERTLRWENLKGGGLNLEAYVLCDDPGWRPEGDSLPPVAAGRHRLLIQAEDFVACHGPQLQVSESGKGYADRFSYAEGDFDPDWAEAPGAEVHIFQTGNCRAFKEICWIDAVDPAARQVRLRGPECTSELRAGDRYFVENVRALLDAPGEWYLDRAEGMLYLMPPAGFTADAEVMAPTVGRIVQAEAPVEGVSFQGLTFRGGDWSFGDGCVGYGMGENGVIYLKGAQGCAVLDCAFTNTGKDAVCLEKCEGCRVLDCDITDSAEGGININGGRGHEISGNHIHHLGQVYKHNGGVTLQNGAAETRVCRNVIHDMTRYGITMKYAGQRNLIASNRVLNTNLETYDTGGIEVTQGEKDERSGTEISGNIVGDTVGYSCSAGKPTFLSWGIYLDSFAGGYTVSGNLVYRNRHGGIMFQGGKDNVVINNVFVDGHDGQGHIANCEDNQRGCILERNIIAFSNPEAYLFAAGMLPTDIIRSDRNLFYCPGVKEYVTGWNRRPLSEWQAAGQDAHSVFADPGFVDPAHDDYRLKPGSPAYALGFEDLDLSGVPSCGCRIEPLAPVFHDGKPWPAGYR